MNGWKYATFGLGALVIAQFIWWNKKAPEVLGLSGLSGLGKCKHVSVNSQRRVLCWDDNGKLISNSAPTPSKRRKRRR